MWLRRWQSRRWWSECGPYQGLTSSYLNLHHCCCICVRFQHTNTNCVWCLDPRCTIVLDPVLRTLFGHQCLIFGQSGTCILTFLSVRINNAPTPSSSFVDRRFFWLKAQRGQHSGEWVRFLLCFVRPSNSSVAPCITMRELRNPLIWEAEEHCHINTNTDKQWTLSYKHDYR